MVYNFQKKETNCQISVFSKKVSVIVFFLNFYTVNSNKSLKIAKQTFLKSKKNII